MPDNEYRDLMAQAWALLRGDTSGLADRLFYLEVIERFGHPALQVGCGTGRLLLDYLGQGIDIDGVDSSPEMLANCRAKASVLGLTPNLHEQYMETMQLPRRYRTILAPSGSLQLIIEQEAVSRAMARLFTHLEPGGALAASFMTLWKQGGPLESVWEKAVRSYSQSQAQAVFSQAGLTDVTVYRTSTFEPARPDDTLFTVVGRKANAGLDA